MYIGCARSPQELELALSLAAVTFRSNEEVSTALDAKLRLMSPGVKITEDDVVVIAGDDQNILGACFLIDRQFTKNDIRIKGTFLSSICIAEAYRGKGLSSHLMNVAIAECGKRSSDFAILIARKAVDHFYNKFGFWGVAAYSRLSFKFDEIATLNSKFAINFATEMDIESLKIIHASVYGPLLGSCERSFEQWRHILWKAKWQGFSFVVFKTMDITAGYVIYSGSDIYEIAASANESNVALLACLGREFSITTFTLHVSQCHPLVRELRDIDFSVTNRQCTYGGHMARIIEDKKLLSIIRQGLKAKCKPREQRLYTLSTDDFVVKIAVGNIDVELLNSAISFRNTCHLLGASYVTADNEVRDLLNLSPFNILVCDQA